jgi:hypothetical protein
MWYPRNREDLREMESALPAAIEPAIEQHFIYETKMKAWRANTPWELEQKFDEAAAIVGSGEVMVQDLIPGDGRQQFAFCAFVQRPVAAGGHVVSHRLQRWVVDRCPNGPPRDLAAYVVRLSERSASGMDRRLLPVEEISAIEGLWPRIAPLVRLESSKA